MVHEPADGTLGAALAGVVGRAAIGAAVVAGALLALALLGELLRRRSRANRLTAVLDRWLPDGARTVAVSLVAVAAVFIGTQPAGADESVRGWLGRPTTSATRDAAVVTPEAVDDLVDPAPAPTELGPVILIPPAVEAAPVSPDPPVRAALPAAPPPPPAESAATPADYVVQPGDCLWSIAARRLGSQADGRAIDAGWRSIYESNRAAVGDNPSLIHPGLVLRLPPLALQP
jgi:LysM repeat protein